MIKDFNSWNNLKKRLDDSNPLVLVHEREIWWCSIGVNVGDEQDGKNESFERPVLVLKKFNKDIVLTVPITSKAKENPYYYHFSHDGVPFAVITSQIRLLSTKRFSRRVRKINDNLFASIRQRIFETSFTTNEPRLSSEVSRA